MAKWLITGGCGFIGLNLIKHLVNDGTHEILILDNMSVGKSKDIVYLLSQISIGHSSVQVIEGDIESAIALDFYMRDIDYVVHLAAISGVRPSVDNPKASYYTNVEGTFNLLMAAKKYKVKKFIFASSGAGVGDHKPPIHEDLPSRPISPYGATKVCGEALCTSFFHSYGLETISLRFSNVYGPYSHRKESLVAKLTNRILNDEIFNIYGDGKQTRDFIHVDDLVAAIIACTYKNDIGGEIFQLCTSIETPINKVIIDIIDIINELGYNTDSKISIVKEKVGDLRTNYADNSKIYHRIGWTPSINLKEGLRSTVEWLIDYHKKRG